MILLSHPTANQNVRQTALAFAEAGVLHSLWTAINWERDGLLDRLFAIAPKIRTELRRRSFPAEVRPFVRSHGFREWGRQIADRLGWEWLTRNEGVLFNIDAVYFSLDRKVARRLRPGITVKAVYGYDGGALETFRMAKQCGILCLYEHPIAYWRVSRKLQEEEAELRPEWASTLPALGDSTEKRERKDQELSLADLVIVPSSFSKQSLNAAPNLSATIRVVPYGADSASRVAVPRPKQRKLRVVFVGALTQAKGLADLLDAAELVKNSIELTLIGRRVSAVVPNDCVLQQHAWIPSLSHPELLQEMGRHDVLVLPSLNEGFGLVLNEAMGQGLTVITTPHTAGADLFTDGVEGFIVPIRSGEAIAEKLLLLDRERDRLATMQEAAQQRAIINSWEDYRRQQVALAREVVGR